MLRPLKRPSEPVATAVADIVAGVTSIKSGARSHD